MRSCSHWVTYKERVANDQPSLHWISLHSCCLDCWTLSLSISWHSLFLCANPIYLILFLIWLKLMHRQIMKQSQLLHCFLTYIYLLISLWPYRWGRFLWRHRHRIRGHQGQQGQPWANCHILTQIFSFGLAFLSWLLTGILYYISKQNNQTIPINITYYDKKSGISYSIFLNVLSLSLTWWIWLCS